jgi:hypothetical protein
LKGIERREARMADEQDNPGGWLPPHLTYLHTLLFGLVLDRRLHVPFLPHRVAHVLDRILDGGASEEDAVLRDLLQKRNHSILAHGLEPMNAKAAARFLEYVDAMVDVPEARIGAEHATLRGL